MNRTWLLVTGVALLVVGGVGLAIVVTAGAAYQASLTAVPSRSVPIVPVAPPASSEMTVGERIYVAGIGSDGPVTNSGGPLWFQRMGGGCAVCHGADGRGRSIRMMGTVTESPDIRYATLSQVGSAEPSATVGPWSDTEIVVAIRDGTEPNGQQLDADMPRWSLTAADAQALLDYLKELK